MFAFIQKFDDNQQEIKRQTINMQMCDLVINVKLKGFNASTNIQKLKINIKIHMNSHHLKTKYIYAVRTDSEQGLLIIIANSGESKEGRVIEQVQSRENYFVFEELNRVSIDLSNLLLKLQIRCLEEHHRYLIPSEDFHLIINEINKRDTLREDEELIGSSDNQNNSSHSNTDSPHYHHHLIHNYHEASSNNQHRGRGRPKGSKNKKTIIKEIRQKNQPTLELKIALTKLIKRGKGRPKGSKNRSKDLIKLESRDVKYEENSHVPFGKRGKGRPKGSKNKIKALNNQHMEEDMDLDRKKRGRPLGARNRPNSIESLSREREPSQQFVKFQFEIPSAEDTERVYCCKRCEYRNLTRKILNGEINLEEIKPQLRNVQEDIGLENKGNLIILAIQIGDWESLEILLSILSQQQNCYKAPWSTEKSIEKTKFAMKTKKEFLSKTGKEGNNVLLHDCWKKKDIWWKELTLERIIESFPRGPPAVEYLLQKLFDKNPELRAEFSTNLATVIRSGNSYLAELILKDILTLLPQKNQINFTIEYYDLLVGNFQMLNHFKKFNLIKNNEGSNFCSPVHCAAISGNSDFLKKLLTIFTDVINVEDNLYRKPIHYAAMSSFSDNIHILVEAGAELKDIDRKRMTPLMLACSQGIYHNVQYILEKVRDINYINCRSDEGYSALHYAILRNQFQCIQLLINDPYVDLWSLTKDKEDIFHLMAGTGNTQILNLILKKQILPISSQDKFKRTPAMIAIRNHNNAYLFKILEEGCKVQKVDSSLNSLLHYAAAYGNIEAIILLKQHISQSKNKRGFYPCEIAILKGHMGASLLLEDEALEFNEDTMYLALNAIRGTEEYFKVIQYIGQKLLKDTFYQEKITGNGYLHLVCAIGEEEYLRIRKQETNLSEDTIKDEFQFIQTHLINYFVGLGLTGLTENKKKETPLKICIENNNLIGFQKFLGEKIDFDMESSSGNTIMHCLSNLACKGFEEIKFVQKKLKESSPSELRINLKKIDHNGFDFLLYFVKNFAESASKIFKKTLKTLSVEKKLKLKEAEKRSFEQFMKFEQRFLNLIEYLLEMGCDINGQVVDRRNESSEKFRKWGVQHFVMRFPSLKILRFLKNKIRDLNSPNNQSMTPLHLFCQFMKKGNLLEAQLSLSDDYQTENALQFLLANGLNANSFDVYKAYPILYAALNQEYSFIAKLRKYKSEINFCSSKNQVPFIEIIKRCQDYTAEGIGNILKMGADPNFADMDKRTSLHHLVYHSTNFDSNPDICKLLLDYGAKINAQDKYDRSPIFYCFAGLEEDQKLEDEPNEKVEILQVLMNIKQINLNLVDVYHRTLVHYACEKNYFFSILYFLDKNINFEAKDYEGNSALAICLKSNNLDQAALIIRKGVTHGHVWDNGNKLTYFQYSNLKNFVGICFMLVDNGYPLQKALAECSTQQFKDLLSQKYTLIQLNHE